MKSLDEIGIRLAGGFALIAAVAGVVVICGFLVWQSFRHYGPAGGLGLGVLIVASYFVGDRMMRDPK